MQMGFRQDLFVHAALRTYYTDTTYSSPLDTQSCSKLRPGRRLKHLGLCLVNLDELAHGKVKEDVLGPAGDAGAHDLAVEH